MPTIAEAHKTAEAYIDVLLNDDVLAAGDVGYILLRDLHRWIEAHPQFVPERPPLPEKRLPMSDEEAKAFELTKMPFGSRGGEAVGHVIESAPSYLEWLADTDFIDELRRYLKSPRVKRERSE